MAVIRGGYAVKPWVQSFVDEVEQRFGMHSFGTYASHQPSPDLAVDCFGTRDQMLSLAMWTTHDDVIDQFGIDYTIHDIDPGDHDPGEIWNREVARRWREMADRGGPTQNHYDHVHVSFEPTAPARPGGSNPPTIHEEEDVKPILVQKPGHPEVYIVNGSFLDHIVNEDHFKWLETKWGDVSVEQKPETDPIWTLPILKP